MVKQVIVLRKDLNMRKGKMVAQGAHASMAVIVNLLEQRYKEMVKGRYLQENKPERHIHDRAK